ncbi:MAG: carboxynorspermidine decarboxylase [Deltaproteobacteria bacterium]|nr:carboxynorspermidine decarboxylase [Deltaproteobacteria bacterium]
MAIDISKIPTPCYVCEEELLQKNLDLLDFVQKKSGAKILLALKGYAMWSTFARIGKVVHGTAASGLWEAKLGHEEMGKEVHTFSPAYKDDEIDEIVSLSDHMIFNSFGQWKRFRDRAGAVSCGMRINPEYSEVETEIYNPCAMGSRLGVRLENFEEDELEGIDGLHFHTLCEQDSHVLERTLKVTEEKFGKYFHRMKWVNFGGGHHITRAGYDVEKLVRLIKNFSQKYNVQVYLEPGEAIGWQTGPLVSSVVDIVNNGVQVAILDVSIANHMPDCLEMPYRPAVRNVGEGGEYAHVYRFGGPTCLAGDFIGDFSFPDPLKIGDKVVFEDMIHYTFVKTTTFNGIKLPSLGIWTKENEFRLVKEFTYQDYKGRLS